MTKVNKPLLSLDAHGGLGRAISFVKRHTVNIAVKKPEVPDAKTLAQLSWRTMYQKCTALWHTLSAAEKQAWESAARPLHMTGFAYWQSQCLRPNPGIYLPLQGGTMHGAIAMNGHPITDLLDPIVNQDADTKAARNAAIAAALYTQGARVYHNVNQSAATGANTTLAFNSERYDTDSIHDPITNNSRLTCKTAGKYLVGANIYWQDNATGRRELQLKLNATKPIAWVSHPVVAATTLMMSVATIWNLAVNDFVQVLVYQNTGAALTIYSSEAVSPEFMMQRIG